MPKFMQCQMRNGRTILVDKLRRIWKKVIAAYCKVLSTSQSIPQCFMNPRVMQCQMRSDDGCECEPRAVNEVIMACSEALS
jgi:hypothetical protein